MMFPKYFQSKHFLSFIAIVLFSGISLLVFSNAQFSNETSEIIQYPKNSNEKAPTFGILIPLEHTSLTEIVTGFTNVVKKNYPSAVFNIQNAQGDIKLQRAIIEQFVGQKVDIIVPIGTTSTQMTLAYVKTIPIVSLAADVSEEERQKLNPRNMTGVLDEIGGEKKLNFIRQVYPNIKKISIIAHSGNEKNFDEISEIESYAKKLNIAIQTLTIHTLPELETVIQSIDKDSEAILVLKDHLIVSGIRLLIPTAIERDIPLITSDEGSVQDGASFALGIQERTIGENGGALAVQIIEGQDVSSLRMQDVSELSVFYNQAAFSKGKQHLDLDTLRAVAKGDGYLLFSK